jgi:hypothetical protein
MWHYAQPASSRQEKMEIRLKTKPEITTLMLFV